MTERFAERMADPRAAHDARVLADFVSIYCDGHHRDRGRDPAATDGAELGLYGRRRPVLCAECTGHLAYAEKRRAFCPKDPKPFCAHCDTHCYQPEERGWQRQMMRFSGPRSWTRGHAIDGVKHLLEAGRQRRASRRRALGAPAETEE